MIGLFIIGGGIALFMIGIAIGINTSLGGTRSDHVDSSGLFAGLGTFAVFVGIAVTVQELLL